MGFFFNVVAKKSNLTVIINILKLQRTTIQSNFSLLIIFNFWGSSFSYALEGHQNCRPTDDRSEDQEKDDVQRKVLEQAQVVIRHLQVIQVPVFKKLLKPAGTKIKLQCEPQKSQNLQFYFWPSFALKNFKHPSGLEGLIGPFG